jgi:hypothetical protein
MHQKVTLHSLLSRLWLVSGLNSTRNTVVLVVQHVYMYTYTATTIYIAACVCCTDVVHLGAAQTMYVLAGFGPHDGDFMFHGHSLVHEDSDMMLGKLLRPYMNNFSLNTHVLAHTLHKVESYKLACLYALELTYLHTLPYCCCNTTACTANKQALVLVV